MGADAADTSQNAVLGGRLQLRQPLRGHRVGHDAILLAAATGGRAGERAVDLGAGVGGAGLALAVRVADIDVTLIEIDAGLCALAAGNVALNGMDKRARALRGNVEDIPALAAAGLAPGSVERVLMNPPFNDAARQNVSPNALRRLAHVGDPALLTRWAKTAEWLLKPRGVLTLIWRADMAAVRDALKPAFGAIAVLPLLPRDDAPPIRLLVRALKGAGSEPIDYPALVLNGSDGQPTDSAEAVLRNGATLPMADL